MTNAKKVGNQGEDVVAQFLIDSDYQILERNYHSRYGEIDIIAKKGELVAFVEVKTRKASSLISPVWEITKGKQNRIIKTSLIYIQKRNLNLQPRFDVCIVVNTNKPEIVDYFENAFDGIEF